MELRSLRERLKMRVAAELDLTRDVEDAEIARMIDRCILEETKDQYVPLKEKIGLRVELFNSLRRLDVLTELLEDETVTEIMVNGQSDIFVERGCLRAERAVVREMEAGCHEPIGVYATWKDEKTMQVRVMNARSGKVKRETWEREKEDANDLE